MASLLAPQLPLVECGRLGRPFGIKGELVVFWNNGICPVAAGTEVIYVRIRQEEPRPYLVSRSWKQGPKQIVTLQNIATRQEAARLTGATLLISSHLLKPLPKGEYYAYQILNLKVSTPTGEILGRIVKILSTGSNDVYVVQGKNQREIYLPATDEVITQIDLEQQKMVVREIEGLLN